MTSFIISSFEKRAEIADKLKSLQSNASQDGCTFCDILADRLPAYKVGGLQYSSRDMLR